MQTILTAGDTLTFLERVPAYPASAGWVLNFRLTARVAANGVINFAATAEGDAHRVTVPAATTAAYKADAYSWSSWATKGAESYTVETGELTIKPDPRQAAAGYDGRSLAVKTLAELKAAFAGWTATNGNTRRYRIADREKEFKSAEEIIQQIAFWESEVQREVTAAASANGTNRGGRMYVRMGR
jgi:hypothetical protein